MKKTLTVLLMALLAVMLITSCEDKVKSYTVTFDVDGNTKTIESVLVEDGKHAEKPAKDPTTTEKYRTFGFWSLDGTTEFKFAETAITGDITLKAVWKDLAVGDRGPAGGIIIYQNPNYSASSTDEDRNWKYIEAAPADATVGDVTTFQMGYFNDKGGTGEKFDTEDGIGKGRSNTAKILESLPYRTKEYYSSSGVMDANLNAAKVASVYTVDGISGWYLPSLAELKLMWEKKTELGMTAETYISSTEVGYDTKAVSSSAAVTENTIKRDAKAAVRAVRYF